jgi:hypothetical protein
LFSCFAKGTKERPDEDMSRHRNIKGWIDDAVDDLADGDYDETYDYNDYAGNASASSQSNTCHSCNKKVDQVYTGG